MKRVTWSAVAAGVVFAAGYIMMITIPGGGDSTDSSFADYYDSSGRRAVGLIGAAVLVLGVALCFWFLLELRAALGASAASIGAQLGHGLAVAGLVLVAAGGAITTGPTGVQLNDDPFVGIPIAQTLSQAGLAVELLAGMSLLALATILLARVAKATGVLANWVAIAGIVAGVIMFGSYIWLPGLIFPIWLVVVGITGLRKPTV